MLKEALMIRGMEMFFESDFQARCTRIDCSLRYGTVILIVLHILLFDVPFSI